MDYVNGIPAFQNTAEAIAATVQYSQEMRAALVGAGGKLADTGPVDFSSALASLGYTGQIIGRRIGSLVQVSGEVFGTIAVGNSSFLAAGAVPAQFRPTDRTQFTVAYMTAGHVGTAFLRVDGSGGYGNQSGASRASFQFTNLYFV